LEQEPDERKLEHVRAVVALVAYSGPAVIDAYHLQSFLAHWAGQPFRPSERRYVVGVVTLVMYDDVHLEEVLRVAVGTVDVEGEVDVTADRAGGEGDVFLDPEEAAPDKGEELVLTYRQLSDVVRYSDAPDVLGPDLLPFLQH
jgi:hypothetical protein